MFLIKQLEIGRELVSLEAIEQVITDICESDGIEEISTYFITLAITELASNMVRHGEPDNRVEDQLSVKVFTSDTLFKVILTDSCLPLPETVVNLLINSDIKFPHPGDSIESIPESGWGLDLIHSAAHSFTYTRFDNRNVYELVFKISIDTSIEQKRRKSLDSSVTRFRCAEGQSKRLA